MTCGGFERRESVPTCLHNKNVKVMTVKVDKKKEVTYLKCEDCGAVLPL